MSNQEQKKFRLQLDNNVGKHLHTNYATEITESDLSDTEESIQNEYSTGITSPLPANKTVHQSKPLIQIPNKVSMMNQSVWNDSELDQSFYSVTSQVLDTQAV